MASVLGGGGEVRVLNAAGGAGRPPLPPSADQFPALGRSSSASHLAAATAGGAGLAAEASSSSSSAGGSRPGSAEGGLVQLQRDDWESVLPRASQRSGSGGSLPRSPSAQEIAPPSPQFREQEERLEARRQRHAEQRQQRAAAAGAAGISEALRAANKLLIDKIRSQLDVQQFAEFRWVLRTLCALRSCWELGGSSGGRPHAPLQRSCCFSPGPGSMPSSTASSL